MARLSVGCIEASSLALALLLYSVCILKPPLQQSAKVRWLPLSTALWLFRKTGGGYSLSRCCEWFTITVGNERGSAVCPRQGQGISVSLNISLSLSLQFQQNAVIHHSGDMITKFLLFYQAQINFLLDDRDDKPLSSMFH